MIVQIRELPYTRHRCCSTPPAEAAAPEQQCVSHCACASLPEGAELREETLYVFFNREELMGGGSVPGCEQATPLLRDGGSEGHGRGARAALTSVPRPLFPPLRPAPPRPLPRRALAERGLSRCHAPGAAEVSERCATSPGPAPTPPSPSRDSLPGPAALRCLPAGAGPGRAGRCRSLEHWPCGVPAGPGTASPPP